jgi:hypothetical protein
MEEPKEEAKEQGSPIFMIEAAELMYDALKELLFLHSCEQEGIASGQPTFEMWMKAYDAGVLAIQKAEGKTE